MNNDEALQTMEQVIREYKQATKIWKENPPIHYSDGDSILRVFGRNVRAERQRQRMIISKLAERSDLAENTLQRCERGKQNVTLETADRIAHALNVPIWTLLTFNMEE